MPASNCANRSAASTTDRSSPLARSTQDARKENREISLADDPRTPPCRFPGGSRGDRPPPSRALDGYDIAFFVEFGPSDSAGSSPGHGDVTTPPPPPSTTASNTVAGGRPNRTTVRTPSAGTVGDAVQRPGLDLDSGDRDSAIGPSGSVHSQLVKPRERAVNSLPGRSSNCATRPSSAGPGVPPGSHPTRLPCTIGTGRRQPLAGWVRWVRQTGSVSGRH